MGNIIPRLSGETFFTLVLEARKPHSGSQEQCFKELLSIYDKTVKDWTGPGLKSTVSQYRNGTLKSGGSYIDFEMSKLTSHLKKESAITIKVFF